MTTSPFNKTVHSGEQLLSKAFIKIDDIVLHLSVASPERSKDVSKPDTSQSHCMWTLGPRCLDEQILQQFTMLCNTPTASFPLSMVSYAIAAKTQYAVLR
jgi:hypothetical protein